ncbi:hypothetical protein CROQUDRAFT_135222 [Cronartium quercuum f. sp. fusiforme G11]|uniref:Uncharacterized protein n=1 Tax=Cronartium quercuum f. sp. fusiforme G11 TaxID=708437 RepID=A0A9P6T9W4_9BASI|nr:hypothetical protein CROQUDRAFT_135222 [Cronartium quercuum f. sp. fusiforme G11]
MICTNGNIVVVVLVQEIACHSMQSLTKKKIKFNTAEDWAKELKFLLDDLLDWNHNLSKDFSTHDTDACLAYSKIKAVYSHKTKDKIAISMPQTLLKELIIGNFLGSVKKLKEGTCSTLFKGLQNYVNSKKKQSPREQFRALQTCNSRTVQFSGLLQESSI